MPPSSAAISAPACRSSGRSRPPRRRTAATGCGWPAPSSRSGPPTPANRPSCWSAPRPRPTSPISAPAMPARRRTRWPCSAARCPSASCGVRRWMPAAVARPARSRRRARPVREAARRARLPAARLHRRFRLGVAARLFPVLRGSRQARRFRAVPGAGRHRQAGADVGRQAALRRRPQARRALQHQSARRPAVDGEGKPAEIGRIQHLCARPQAVRALHRARLCAAAHRPARHSRWSASTRRR